VIATSTDTLPRDLAAPPGDGALFREQADAIMRAALVSGAVILGRAGAAAFRDEPGVLRVRLFGPAEARVAQAARIESTDEATAAAAARGGPGPRALCPPSLPGRHRRPGPVPLHIDSTRCR